ncbi:MAG: YARHG domain-containing protein [Clostridiales bacterium]|nr:YARHG domain-containing protein [Clostridiales bacterium]
MKRTGINIGLMILSICLAGISFEILVYLGLQYSWLYRIVRHFPAVLLAVLLFFWLSVIWLNLSGRQSEDIWAMTVVRGPADLTLEQLKDEQNFQLLRDHKAERIRKYRNKINGEMLLVTYEKPKPQKKKGGCLKRLICIALIALLLIPGAAVSRLGQWNQKLETMLNLPDSQSLTYFATEEQPDLPETSAGGFWTDLRDNCVAWVTGWFSDFHLGNRGQYIFPDSDRKELTEADIAGMDTQTIQLAINEIYARRGYSFPGNSESAQAARDYFMSKDWYSPTVETMAETETLFSEVEQKNIIFLAGHR